MAGKMLIERTIFRSGRGGTDARCEGGPVEEKQEEDRLRQGEQVAGKRRERYSHERGTGQEEGESPQARDGSHSGTLPGMVCPVAVPSLGGDWSTGLAEARG